MHTYRIVWSNGDTESMDAPDESWARYVISKWVWQEKEDLSYRLEEVTYDAVPAP